MKTVLVTGGGGFLGTEILKQLIEKGYSVRSFSRKKYPELKKLGVNCFEGDICDKKALEKAMKSCDAVIHTAALAGFWGAWQDYYKPNVLGTENVIKTCEKLGIKNLVYTSSPSVVFNGEDIHGSDESIPYATNFSGCAYPKTKMLAEKMVLASSLNTVALRPHIIWGENDPHFLPRLLQAAKTGRVQKMGDLKNKVSVTHVKNAAYAHLLALEKLEAGDPSVIRKAYFVSDENPVEVWSFLEELLKTQGFTKKLKGPMSATLAFRVGLFLEWVFKVFPFLGEPPLTRFVALTMTKSHYFSHKRAEKELGYFPMISKEKGLQCLTHLEKSLK